MLSGNSLRQTVHTHRASVHQAAKLVAAGRLARVTAGLAEINVSLPPGLWLTSPAGWLPRSGISSGTLCSVIEYGLPLPCLQSAPEHYWRSLQRVEKVTDSVHACRIIADEHFEHLLWVCQDADKSWTHKLQLTFSKKMFLSRWFSNFHGVKVFQGKADTLSRWGGKLNQLVMAYLLPNNYTKYYLNRTTTFKIIVAGWVVYTGWSNVTRAMATIRSPFCGYNIA